jgi:hypothetical protein
MNIIIRRCPMCNKKNRLRGYISSNKCGKCQRQFSIDDDYSDDKILCPCCGEIPPYQVEYKVTHEMDSTATGGALGGAIAGAAKGSAIASLVPIVGTAIGGLVGGIVGGLVAADSNSPVKTQTHMVCSICDTNLGGIPQLIDEYLELAANTSGFFSNDSDQYDEGNTSSNTNTSGFFSNDSDQYDEGNTSSNTNTSGFFSSNKKN